MKFNLFGWRIILRRHFIHIRDGIDKWERKIDAVYLYRCAGKFFCLLKVKYNDKLVLDWTIYEI
jgi:hypothetical protein